MDDTFGPEDGAAFEAERDRLIASFSRSGGAGFEHVAEQVLDFKWNYLDGDLRHWSVEDVEEILFHLYPAKVVIDAESIAEVPAGFAALLRFVGHDQPDHEPPLAVLAEAVERSASKFIAAMNDEDNWSFGKRMWSTALGEGVDLSDEAAVGQWMAGFNERSLAERDQILGKLPSAQSLGAALIGPLPPVVLAPDEELQAIAAGTVLVRRLIALVAFVGEGRAVTDRENLKLADGKELVTVLGTNDRFDEQIGDRVFKTVSSEDLGGVDLIYRVALASRLLEIDRRKVRPGPNAGWVESPLDLAYGAFLALVRLVGPTQYRYRKDHYGFGWFAEELDAQLPSMLLELYRSRDPYEIDELAAAAWDRLLDVYDLSDVPADKLERHRGYVDSALRLAFDLLAELGIVTIAGEVCTPRQHIGFDRSGGTVELAPLGLWAVQRMVSRVTDAPIAGALRAVPAAELLRAASDLPGDVALVELDAWIDHHGEWAAAELCEALRTADETGRGLAFRALLRIGPPASDAVAALADDAELVEFVTVFRVDTLAAAPDEMDRAGDPEAWVRLLHTVIELWGPAAAAAAWAVPAAGAPGIDKMFDAAWRVKGERTEEVLAAIGGHHPDKHIAKSARKALFKHRSAR